MAFEMTNDAPAGVSFAQQMPSIVPGRQQGVAQILVGPTTPVAAFNEIVDDRPYDLYQVECQAVWDTGLVQLPATGVGPSPGVSAVVKAHGGMLKLITTWVVGRTGVPPVLPAFILGNQNLVPLRAVVVAQEVIPSADGADVCYMTAGFYEHAVLDPSRFSMVGATPPLYSSEVAGAASLGHTAWADFLYPATVVAPGANPFVLNGFGLNQAPTSPPGFSAPVPFITESAESQNQPGSGSEGVVGPVINA
jgi:hypothetical protein